MTIKQLTAAVHQNAVSHVWHETKCNFAELIARCHSELSEALEEYRKSKRCTTYF